jgi:hypothetical protein
VSDAKPVPVRFHPLFWDCDVAALDLEAHSSLILTRLLDYGDLAAARWALQEYGAARIRRFLIDRGWKTMSRKTIAFWRAFLHLENEPCLQTSSRQDSRPFWNV